MFCACFKEGNVLLKGMKFLFNGAKVHFVEIRTQVIRRQQ